MKGPGWVNELGRWI